MIETIIHQIMNTLLVEAWDEIDKDQADSSLKSKKHLSLDHAAEDQCSTESFFFACSCQKFSLSHRFEFIRAAALIISFKELLSTWMTEFYFHIDHSHFLKMKLRMYVAYKKAWFLINILIKLLETNLNVISEKNDLKIIWWDHEN